MLKILFVCRANICRSPTAHGVLNKMLEEAGLESTISVDSAGTDAPYPGRRPDQRARKVAAERGYDISDLNAQQLTPELAAVSDHIVVMDDRNFADVLEIIDPRDNGKVVLLLSFTDEDDQQLRDPFHSGSAGMSFIPDPVDSGERAFRATIKKIENALEHMLSELR